MEQLSSIIYQFVKEKQRLLQHDFEYKREILILDATDHQLLQKFFTMEPNKSQIISARRTWEATKKQMLVEEDIALLKHRLTSTQIYVPPNLIDHMIDDIDTTIKHSNTGDPIYANDLTVQNDIAQLELLKKNVIHQAIITSQRMAANLNRIIQIERNKFSVNNRFIESTSEWQQTVLNTIQTSRVHMMKRTNLIIQHKLESLLN